MAQERSAPPLGNAPNPALPTASLTSTRNNSAVVGVGTDVVNDTPRTAGASQVVVHEFLSVANDNTFWMQARTIPVAASGTLVTINDTAPAARQLQPDHRRGPPVSGQHVDDPRAGQHRGKRRDGRLDRRITGRWRHHHGARRVDARAGRAPGQRRHRERRWPSTTRSPPRRSRRPIPGPSAPRAERPAASSRSAVWIPPARSRSTRSRRTGSRR